MRDVGLPLPWAIVPAEVIRKVVTGDDPAAGAEVSVTVPGGELWEVQSLEVNLVTSAVVANRLPRLILDDGVTEFARIEGDISGGQAASTSMFWTWVVGGVFHNQAASAWCSLLPPIQLPGGYRLRTSTLGVDVGDNFGPPALYVYAYQVRGLERAVQRYEREVAEAIAAPG